MSRYRAQVTEVINRNVVVSLALQQGFNAFLPVYDGGVDFILYRESDNTVRKVQLKGQRGAWIRGRGALTPTPPGVMRRGRSLGVPGPACG